MSFSSNGARGLTWSTSLPRLAATAAIGLTLALASCGNRDAPFADGAGAGATTPLVVEATGPAPTDPADDVPQATSTAAPPPTTTPTDTPESKGTDQSTLAEAPSPAGSRPDPATKAGKRPRSLSQRVAADSTAKLNVRTMVSIIEGCHSGRESYKACNTHGELGSPSLLGLKIGKERGRVQISATENGFRITGHSMSGAKFTIARGPSGDRFKCIQGRMPGACPADRAWSF